MLSLVSSTLTDKRVSVLPSLRYNPKHDEFVICNPNLVRAEDTGLTLSRSATGPNGEPMYFTKDSYAALNFIKDGDAAVKTKLNSLWTDYEASWADVSSNDYPMGSGIKLRGYQNAAIDYGINRGNFLVGDEPGIGKTFTAIGACNHWDARKVLCICPGAIRDQWKREIKKASILEKVRVYPIMRSADGVANWPNYTVISYDLLRNPGIHEALCQIKWDAIILDEAHLLKEITARRTQAIFGGGRRAEFQDPLVRHVKDGRIIALTGTPLPNRPRECYTLTRALCWEAIDFMSEEAFRYRFNPSGRLANGFVREEKGRLPELQARLRCNYMVRRLKEDVLKDLPPKTYEFAYIEKSGAISDVIQRERMLNFNLEDLKKPTIQLLGEISTIRREMGEAKVPQTIQHMKYLLDIMELPKVVMFSHHKSVMNRLLEALGDYGVVEVRGGMTSNARTEAVESFIKNPAIRIFSGQLESSGVGIDGLQRVANHVVVVEPAWTSGANEQAIDRLHRSEQHANVIAQFIVVEGSLDERILASVINKTHTVHEALDNRKRREI